VAHGTVEEPFFAPRSIEVAENWKDQVRSGLNCSSVLVCMQSPLFYASNICGKELEIFLQRRKLYRKLGGDPPSCIIPVLWEPLSTPPPKAVPNDFQGKPSSELTAFGMSGLYEAILDDRTDLKENINRYALTLARRISNLIQKNVADRSLPMLPWVPDLEVIPSAFDFPEWPLPDVEEEMGTGPASITFLYPANIPPDKLPFAPPPPNAVIAAAALAKNQEWIYQGVGFDGGDDSLEKKIQWAQSKRSPMVLMLTETILGDRDLLKQFAALSANGIATMVLSTTSTGVFPPDFPANLRPNASFTTREGLDNLLIAKLGRLRTNLMAEPTSSTSGSLPGF